MTNNPTIDGVSRELLRNLLHCGDTASTITPYVTARIRELLDAPAVERQEPVAPFYISADDRNLLVRGDIDVASVRVSRTRRGKFTEALFAHPFALQSTIAQLQARVQELESGRGEPLAEVQHGPFDDVGAPQWVRVVTLGDYDLEHIPDGTKLYTAPPAPVAVVLPELFEKSVRDAWWSGFNNGKNQQFAGHSAGYQNQECESYVIHACLDATAALNGQRK